MLAGCCDDSSLLCDSTVAPRGQHADIRGSSNVPCGSAGGSSSCWWLGVMLGLDVLVRETRRGRWHNTIAAVGTWPTDPESRCLSISSYFSFRMGSTQVISSSSSAVQGHQWNPRYQAARIAASSAYPAPIDHVHPRYPACPSSIRSVAAPIRQALALERTRSGGRWRGTE